MTTQLRNWRDVMDDRKAPQCLRFFLQAASKPSLPGGLPPLYATLKREFAGRLLSGPIMLRFGDRVRVTDLGRFGDIGITTHLDEAVAYMARASVDELERFAETP